MVDWHCMLWSWHPVMDRHIPRLFTVFIILTVSGFILLISNIISLKNLNDQLISTFYKIQSSTHSDFKPAEISWPVKLNHTYCAHIYQEPVADEAKEERDLLNSIAWPGPLGPGLPVELSSNPAKSYFVIQGPSEQYIGDQLVVNVHVQNVLGLPKEHGGDFLIGRLHSPKLGAGVSGKVLDHHDGNYTVLFPLLWAGKVFVEIIMVHSSEAVVVLKRLQEEQPDRIVFVSQFRSGNLSEWTMCNMCLPLNKKRLCNYTDPLTGEPWYCYKPKKLGCDTRINHYTGRYKKNLITNYEAQFFKSGVNLKVPIKASLVNTVTVLPADKRQAMVKYNFNTSGYYFHNTWRSLNGAAVQQFNDPSAITRCLRGKIVYMFGDSTLRQWFEYLTAFVPDLKRINLYTHKKVGPFMAVDNKNNILVNYHYHGVPVRIPPVPSSEMRYIANELDRIKGGPETVVLLSVWAHFNTFPIEVYIRRLRNIRRAVLRLLERDPRTLVVIRTASLQNVTPEDSMFNSDWFSIQIDTVLRAMFKGLNVKLLDAWEMTLAHHLPHDLHPPQPIIKNMVNVMLSYICPV